MRMKFAIQNVNISKIIWQLIIKQVNDKKGQFADYLIDQH